MRAVLGWRTGPIATGCLRWLTSPERRAERERALCPVCCFVAVGLGEFSLQPAGGAVLFCGLCLSPRVEKRGRLLLHFRGALVSGCRSLVGSAPSCVGASLWLH